MPGVFQFGTFFSVALSESRCMSALGPSSRPCNSFFMFIHSSFLLCSFRYLILHLNCFVFLSSSRWYASVHSPIRIFGLVLECPVLSVLFIPSRYLFSLLSYGSTFWFNSSCCIICFNCLAFLFSSQHISAFFFCLIIFSCRFLICVSSIIFHAGF